MNYQVLVLLVIGLTATMFATRQVMLGFPCAIFWGVLGGYAYTQSAATWDIDYLLFFASIGMAIFSMLAMYGLKTKKEQLETGDGYLDEEPDDSRYLDEDRQGGRERALDGDDTESPQVRAVRGRTSDRRAELRARADDRRRRLLRRGL